MSTKKVMEAEPEQATGNGNTTIRPRHIVALDETGAPSDKCLCGYVWDRFNPPHNGFICQECVDALEKFQHDRKR
jgi:hypothetical protein